MRNKALALIAGCIVTTSAHAQSPLSFNFPTKDTVDWTTYNATLMMISGSAQSLGGTAEALTIYFSDLENQGCLPAQGEPAQINCRSALAALATIHTYSVQLITAIDTNQFGYVGPTQVLEYLRNNSVNYIAQAQANLSAAYEYDHGFGIATVRTTGDESVDYLSQTLFDQYLILLSNFIPRTDPNGNHSILVNRAGMEGGLGRDRN